MQNRIRGDEFRTTIACIDSYEDGIFVGRLYNPQMKAGEHFLSLTQFLIKMENALDELRLPQSFTVARAFAPPARLNNASQSTQEPKEGKLATFAVRILFRQNASWQGSVTWSEGGREESFRSVLELILLMNSAMQETLAKEKRHTATNAS